MLEKYTFRSDAEAECILDKIAELRQAGEP